MNFQNPSNRKRLQAKILTGFACNNQCLFCFDRLNRHLPEKTTEQLHQEMLNAKKLHFTDIHLLGGEPTIRKDFFKLILFAKKIGFDRIAVTSNARMFQYKDFVKESLRAGINQFILSIHGHNAETHDLLTACKGSFAQVLQGLKNLKSSGVKNIRTNTTVVKQNCRFIPGITKFLLQEKIEKAEFIYVAAGPDNFKAFTPRISEAGPLLYNSLSLAKQKGGFWRIQNAPMPCYFGQLLSTPHMPATMSIFIFLKAVLPNYTDLSKT